MTTPKQAAAELQRLHDQVVSAANRATWAAAEIGTEAEIKTVVRLSEKLGEAETEFSAALRRLFDLPEHSND